MEHFKIQHIPATLWGEKSDHVFIAVHGNQSNKEDTVIQLLAEAASKKGYQVLSFDLPEHGDRAAHGKRVERGDRVESEDPDHDGIPCKVQYCVKELQMIMDYAQSRWREISLFACSMGAYFSLLAYRDSNLRQALFLSPVVDMERMIHNMMSWFNVTPDRLKLEEEIETPIGQTLYWDYYCYVRENPIMHWSCSTSILYGRKDELCEYDTIAGFTQRFHCALKTLEEGGHFFHTEKQLAAYKEWLLQRMQ